MTTIDRSQFTQNLSSGINLKDAATRYVLEQRGVSVDSLSKSDANGDGWLKGDELAKTFQGVDDFDRNGSRDSIALTGKAGDTYQALLEAAKMSKLPPFRPPHVSGDGRMRQPAFDEPKKGPSEAMEALDAFINGLETAELPQDKALKESLALLKAALELKDNPLETRDDKLNALKNSTQVLAAMKKATAALIEWSAQTLDDPEAIGQALEGAAMLDKLGSFIQLPATASDLIGNLRAALQGTDEDGRMLSQPERLKKFAELGLNVKDLLEGVGAGAEGASALLSRFPALAARLGQGAEALGGIAESMGIFGPALLAGYLTQKQAEWVMKEVYGAQQGFSRGMMGDYTGGSPLELSRNLAQMHVTYDDARQQIDQLVNHTFDKGLPWKDGSTLQQEWKTFVGQALKRDMTMKGWYDRVKQDPYGKIPDTGLQAMDLAKQLRTLAIDFIEVSKKKALIKD
jgi:hypothetical protein